MTDLAALAPCPFCGGPAEESTGHAFIGGFSKQIHCGNCHFNIKRQYRSEVAAAWNTRSLTTAMEMGRAMGIEEAAKVCDPDRLFGGYSYDELTDDFGQPRWDLAVQLASSIRALTPAVDVRGLTERIARAIGDNVHDEGGFDMAGEFNQRIYRSDARAVLSELGLGVKG